MPTWKAKLAADDRVVQNDSVVKDSSLQSTSICGLCGQADVLRNSHILPAFVFRWLRETSATGHIRSIGNINLRIQDGEKKSWLCSNCEVILGRDERDFSSKLFYPWQSGTRTVEYQSWLLRFCTSISWRVLTHCKGSNAEHQYSADEDRLAEKAELVWRNFLLGRRNSIGKFEQHLLPLDLIEKTTISELPDNINRYLTRNIEMDVLGGPGTFMTYAKLGGFAIFGMMRKSRNWGGTRVYGYQGRIEPQTYTLPGAVMHFFMDRARMSKAALGEMTPAQVAKIDVALMSDLDRFANSPFMRAAKADVAMFGEQAILRSPPSPSGKQSK